MGLGGSAQFQQQLISWRHDLEGASQQISMRRAQLATQTEEYMSFKSQLGEDSPAAKQMQGRIDQLNEADKILEAQAKRYDTQLAAVRVMEENTQKTLDSEIKTLKSN
jgi:regulatory protein YycH of two-component signal transduction system YycFG